MKTFIIPRYFSGGDEVQDETYYSDFEKLIDAFTQNRYILWELKTLSFIRARNFVTQQTQLKRAEEIYFLSPELEEYFQGSMTAFFVAPELYDHLEKEKVDAFLKALGVADYLRRVGFESEFSYSERYEMRTQSRWHDSRCTTGEKISDYTLDGLTNALLQTNSRVSMLLWSQLHKILSGLGTSDIDAFFQGKYAWYYRSEKETHFEAQFIRVLRDAKWLQTKQGILSNPREITIAELNDDYDTKSRESRVLIEKLMFKPDLEQQYVAQMSEEQREQFQNIKEILARGISSEALRKLAEQYQQDEKPKEWEPEVAPNGKPVVFAEPEPEAGKNFPPSPRPDPEPPKPEPEPHPTAPKPHAPLQKKEIGRWGEEYVFEGLKQEYLDSGNLELTDYGFKVISQANETIEIIWMNIGSDKGEGYDFAIKVDGKDVRYIEVKSRQTDEPDFIGVTGTQWECARQFSDAYWLYVVSSAGKESSEITRYQNPYRLWSQGKLYAHPVNIRL